ncbi:diguanylate cyclase [Rhodopseudomonas thermotolerans]|uniref:diguanylate cyclase n=2 Tax=Rhodopseudomonas TaxID=1073 RepID=A0A336JU71_9BRAD|nr:MULTISPECIES: diguanylate cyclase [Rhodopseudomonas]RED25849.1 diguanylate cyclase [Rhodopseudomonas pentothenatexigens]REF90983.1 diguanylate cyclase [Rhodopseudomonas thermotolerans]SSW93068.1 diguanylate cyclase [Rhodopseudomonas pentothenatexigens]
MSRIAIVRKKAKLRAMLGIRARLVVLALILVCPLMLDRVRLLEQTRTAQLAAMANELSTLAQRTADAEREVISSVEAVLKSAAYVHAAAAQAGRSCSILRASLRVDLPSIRMLMVAGPDGIVRCSTSSMFVGVDISDRGYFRKAMETHDFVVSDFLVGRQTQKGTILAAYPVSAIDTGEEAVIVAGMNLDWLSDMMSNLAGRPGVSAALIDGEGTVLATPPDERSLVGKKLERLALLPALAEGPQGRDTTTMRDATGRLLTINRIPGTSARLVVTVDENKVSAGINHDIRTAYLQLALVCLFVLLGALIAAERLIVQPISVLTAVANKFAAGDWSARVAKKKIPSEFVPLARAFNAMAAQLGQRERELVASNSRLSVMASMDLLSGLANRRGFQSRLEFEWMKGQQTGHRLALMMIDVDHFKLFNDSYGHPEGDACLSRIGETLAAVADQTGGFAARYGGEEFCLLLPDTGPARAIQVGELVRATIEQLALPHRTSAFEHVTVSIGVACTLPSEQASPAELVEAADAALYAAKHRGRNNVVEHGFTRADDGPVAMAS